MPELQKQESVTDLIGGDLTGIINLTSGSSDSILDRVRRLMDIKDRPVSEPYITETYNTTLSNYADYNNYLRQFTIED
jgi:hypothetical protein